MSICDPSRPVSRLPISVCAYLCLSGPEPVPTRMQPLSNRATRAWQRRMAALHCWVRCMAAPPGGGVTVLLAALHWDGTARLRIFWFFCEITKKKKTCVHPLDSPEPPLGPSVPIREDPIREGPTRIGSRFSNFEPV
jgi:hypothetical protein